MNILEANQLTLRFGGLTAVHKVDFTVYKGEILALIGPNGAGKTTVFNAITGVYNPTSGHILFEGRRVRRALTWRVAIGIALLGVSIAVGLVLAINLEALWETAINANYVWQQPFPWKQALRSVQTYFVETEARYTWTLFFVGSVIGVAGSFVVWRRARRTPDVIAAQGIARTFQNIRLFPQMTAIENVLVGMDSKLRVSALESALRLPRFWRERRSSTEKALEILRFVELEHAAHDVAGSFSYGHQRRLEIARALAAEPRLLLLDEPAAGMNPSESMELMRLIRKIRDKGVSILLIEHDMKVVMGVSDRIVVLDYGNKIAEGEPEAIRANPKVMEAYLGTAEAS